MLLSQCREQCDAQQTCLRPDACGKVPPDALPGNREAWSLYQMLRSQWNYAGLGGRVSYDYVPLIHLAQARGAVGEEITDLVERVNIIEAAVLDTEAQVTKFERERREMEEAAAKKLGRAPQQRSPRHRS